MYRPAAPAWPPRGFHRRGWAKAQRRRKKSGNPRSSARPGDVILLSGPIGDHGITILLARGELDLEADLGSDTRPVPGLVEALAEAAVPGLRWMRDPTRGMPAPPPATTPP